MSINLNQPSVLNRSYCRAKRLYPAKCPTSQSTHNAQSAMLPCQAAASRKRPQPCPRLLSSSIVQVRSEYRSEYSSVSELSYSDAVSCTVAASGISELIGVELVRQGNRIPSLEGLGLNGDNALKRFRRPHDKSWGHLARPGLQPAEVLSQGGESGALLSTRGSSFSPQWLGSNGRAEGAPEGP